MSGLGLELVFREWLRGLLREELTRMVAELRATTALPQPSAPGDYLATTDAAKLAGVEPATIRDWVRRKDLSRNFAGRELRIRRAELEAFLASGRRSDRERSVDAIAARMLNKGRK